jgi:hypothetical protein
MAARFGQERRVQRGVARGGDHPQVDVAEGQGLVVVHADPREVDVLVG